MSIGAPLFTDCEHKTSRVPSLLLNAFPSQRTVSTQTMSQSKPFYPQGDFVRSLVTSVRKVISTVAHVSPGEMSDITEMSSGKIPSFLPLPSSDLWKVRTLMPTHLKKAKRLVKSRAWINSKTLRSFSNHQLPTRNVFYQSLDYHGIWLRAVLGFPPHKYCVL